MVLSLAIAVFLIATILGTRTSMQSGFAAEYFFRFGPALSIGCGGPFENIVTSAVSDPALNNQWVGEAEAFLSTSADSFDCSSLPENLVGESPRNWQTMHRYSIYFVGGIWRIFGPSWNGFALIFGLMFGASALFAFLISRYFMNHWLAALVSLIYVTSGSMMLMMSFYRDFARAPFILAIVTIMVVLVARSRTPKFVLGMSALGGLVAGIGFGFRTDLLATLPLFGVVSLLLFAVPWEWRSPKRLLPAAVFGIVFLISAFPILQAYSENNFIFANYHPVEGLLTPFNENLGLEQPLYDHGTVYLTYFSFVKVVAFVARENNLLYRTNDGNIPTFEADLSDWSRDYNLQITQNYPADTLIRTIRSIEKTATLPFVFAMPHGEDSIWVIRNRLSETIKTIAVNPLWIFILATIIAGYKSRRLGIFLALLVAYFGILNTTQFQHRQVFHHEIWAWIGLGIVLVALWSLVTRAGKAGMHSVVESPLNYVNDLRTDEQFRKKIATRGAIALLLIAMIPISLLIARNYQQSKFQSFVNESLASAQSIDTGVPEPYDQERVIYKFENPLDTVELPRRVDWGGVRYFAVTFSSSECDITRSTIDFVHLRDKDLSTPVDRAFDRSFEIMFDENSDGGETAQILFPAYYALSVQFTGMVMDRSMSKCLTEVAEIPVGSGTSLTPYVFLGPDWEREPAYLKSQ